VSYRETLEEMCRADILLLMDTPGRRIGVPAKLYEYLGAGRPILATGEFRSDLIMILHESGAAFRLASPGDVSEIRQALVELVQGVASGTIQPTTEEKRKQFSREILAQELAKWLNGLRKAAMAARSQS
jgi:glycosyltransferase involved in cell wall biosynthesis